MLIVDKKIIQFSSRRCGLMKALAYFSKMGVFFND